MGNAGKVHAFGTQPKVLQHRFQISPTSRIGLDDENTRLHDRFLENPVTK